MNRLRSKLTYSNVISTLCLFLLLGGGTAFAANQLAKKSVGTKQLKNNAVTAAKIKKNAVTSAKIKKGAVSGSKIKGGSVTGSNIAGGTITGANLAGGTVTGANINAPSTPFSQAVARLRTSAQSAFETESLYQLGSYVQPAGEDDQYLASLTVSFAPSCGGERQIEAYLVKDAPTNIKELSETNIIGLAFLEEKGGGPAARTLEFVSYPIGGLGAMSTIAPAAATTHSFSIYLGEAECETGSGVTATGGAIDIIGTK